MRGSRILARGRRMASERMSETVQVGLFGEGVDPETGDSTRVLLEERYTGPGRVRYPSLTVHDPEGAAQLIAVQDITVSLPADSPLCFQGDEVVVVSSEADAALVGKRYTVKGSAQVGQTSAHRYPVSELS